MVAGLLALRCYDMRGVAPRRRAEILHRLAWLAREQGEEALERRYLARAREAYEAMYEEDTTLSDAAAIRVSYLLGELAYRLGQREEAIRWFERTSRMEGIDSHREMQRLLHDRWIDAREDMRRRKAS